MGKSVWHCVTKNETMRKNWVNMPLLPHHFHTVFYHCKQATFETGNMQSDLRLLRLLSTYDELCVAFVGLLIILVSLYVYVKKKQKTIVLWFAQSMFISLWCIEFWEQYCQYHLWEKPKRTALKVCGENVASLRQAALMINYVLLQHWRTGVRLDLLD